MDCRDWCAVVFVVRLLGDVLLLVFAAALLALGLRDLANLLSRVVDPAVDASAR
jgi:hypothetical protein